MENPKPFTTIAENYAARSANYTGNDWGKVRYHGQTPIGYIVGYLEQEQDVDLVVCQGLPYLVPLDLVVFDSCLVNFHSFFRLSAFEL